MKFIFGVLIVVAVMCCAPLLFLWSYNTLVAGNFATPVIAYTWQNCVALLVLISVTTGIFDGTAKVKFNFSMK